jgi:hypothetical protein
VWDMGGGVGSEVWPDRESTKEWGTAFFRRKVGGDSFSAR